MSFQADFFPPPPSKRPDLEKAKRLLQNPFFKGECRAVVQLLVDNFGKCITQREIAKVLPGLGPHQHDAITWFETTTRKIREICRTLRIKYGLFVCSFPRHIRWGSGYCLEFEHGQAAACDERMDKEVPARNASSSETLEKQKENLRNRNEPPHP